jgi:hypothetical protein
MKRCNLTALGATLALSICGSESCFAAGNDQSARTEDDAAYVMMSLFGAKSGPMRDRAPLAFADPGVQIQSRTQQAIQKDEKAQKAQQNQGDVKNGNEPMKDQGIKPSDDVKKFKDEHAMASNQGEDATQTFINILNGEFTVAKDAKTANRDGAWEHAKDAAQDAIDAARNAANTARDSATSATDNCKDHSMGGHP